ncbi:MAG: hypothetical protein ACI9DF_005506 [Verrucomicrobiales bacterium]|jgi:hypothetical protein
MQASPTDSLHLLSQTGHHTGFVRLIIYLYLTHLAMAAPDLQVVLKDNGAERV